MRLLQLTAFLFAWVFVACSYTNEEMKRIVQNNGKSKVIMLKENNYEKFLEGPRDYHIALVLSSSAPQFNCPLCIEFKPEYEIVANSWYKDHPNGVDPNSEAKDIYFLFAEFMGAKLLFQKMELQSIPKAYHLPPSTDKRPSAWMKEAEEYQFFQGKHSELVAQWVGDVTGHKVNIYVPVNYNRVILNAAITFTLLVLLKVFWGQVKHILFSKFLWTGLSIVLILLFISGYMFVQIRGVPYIREHKDGKVEYFLPGQQAQLGFESQVISVVYGLLSLLFVGLVKKVPEILHPRAQLIATWCVSVLIFTGFSFILSFFTLKSPGYPFRFVNFP